MARKRFVTSGMSVDKQLAKIAKENPTAALMWPWFITAFDDWGRMGADPEEINLEIFPGFPYSDEDIAAAIKQFDNYKIAHYYIIDGRPYLEVNPETWFKMQTYIKKERKLKQLSKFPAPMDAPWTEKENQQLSAIIADSQQQSPENVPSPSPSLSPSPIKDINNYSSELKASDPSTGSKDSSGESKTKKKIKVFPVDSVEYRLSAHLRERILQNDSNARVPELTPEGMARWCKDMDLLIRVDARAPDEVEKVINWCQSDRFWKSNILSVGKLRDQFTKLKLQSGEKESCNNRHGPVIKSNDTDLDKLFLHRAGSDDSLNKDSPFNEPDN